mmetsp:Transcript_328/g.453  ORF Transcript_328/g.453 Transcript_328/m.453 type:complete len:805 (+) Transcript_328:1-2415(+)
MSSLKINLPLGASASGKNRILLKFKASHTVKDAVEEVIKSQKLPGRGDDYVLVAWINESNIPSSSHAQQNTNQQPPDFIWFEDAKLISHYTSIIKQHHTVELRRHYQIIRFKLGQGVQRLLIDINTPLKDSFPYICKKFQIPLASITDYRLVARKKELDASKSIRACSLPTNVTFFIITKSENIEDCVDDINLNQATDALNDNEGNDNNNEEQEQDESQSFDINNVSFKTLKDGGSKTTSVGFRKDKKKKFETKYLAVKDNYLLVYKSSTDKKPKIVVNLGDRNVKLQGYPPSALAPEKAATSKKDADKDSQLILDILVEPAEADPKEKEPEAMTLSFKFENVDAVKTWGAFIKETKDKLAASAKANLSGQGLVFGVPIEVALKANGTSNKDGEDIPNIVKQCIAYIQQKALDVVGIFRLSGSATTIEEYRKAFDAGEPVDLFKETDPHAVSGLLKLYFRMLPQPILTFQLYDKFIAAQCAPLQDLRIRYIRTLVDALPGPNKALLKVLIKFLIQVKEHEQQNKMGIPNLATVFGPNLLVNADNNMIQMIQDTPVINSLVNTLIQDYDLIFNDKLPDTFAVAQFDFQAQEEGELSFTTGTRIQVLSQGEDGWWHGILDGKVGRFPGSYVKIEVKSKKAQFLEDMKNVKNRVQVETEQLKFLEDSKAALLNDIAQMQEEQKQFEQQMLQLKENILDVCMTYRVDLFQARLGKYYPKLQSLQAQKAKTNDLRAQIMEDIRTLHVFLNNPPPEAKKTLKGKVADKLDTQIENTMAKVTAETKKKAATDARFDELVHDMTLLNQLMKD